MTYGPEKQEPAKTKVGEQPKQKRKKKGTRVYRHESTDVNLLFYMLQYCRPASSLTEEAFIKRFIKPLGTRTDKMGNEILSIGDQPVMWSCHTDTVHRKSGRQKLKYAKGGKIMLKDKSPSNCLGADDTGGVWLMHQMITHNVPGLYIFHRSEECGAIGSSFIAEDTPEILDGMKCCIALDRRGECEVITHQRASRCASDEFCKSVGAALGIEPKLRTGAFTDSASYVDIIGECTNISIGYEGAHSYGENLDLHYIINLRDKLLDFDFSKLVYKRKPGEREVKTYGGFWSRHNRGFDDPYSEGWSDEGGYYYGGNNYRHVGRGWQSARVSHQGLTLEERQEQAEIQALERTFRIWAPELAQYFHANGYAPTDIEAELFTFMDKKGDGNGI